jgi:four helix bundle protein
MIFGFRDFPVYKELRLFRKEVKRLSREHFPKEEQHVLSGQLWRALDSPLLNIAEGSDRYSGMDSGRFINNATTSMNEVVACLDAALDDGYITGRDHAHYLDWAEKITGQLMAFSASLRRRQKSSVLGIRS